MIDAKRLAEEMKPERLKVLADKIDTMQGDVSGCDARGWGHRDVLDCAAAVLRKVAELKSRTSMEVRDAGHGKEFIFRAMYSETELRERVGQSVDICRQLGMDVRRKFEDELYRVLPEIRKG